MDEFKRVHAKNQAVSNPFTDHKLFCDPSGRAFVRFRRGEYSITLPIDSAAYRGCLLDNIGSDSDYLPNKRDLDQAILFAQARARRSGVVTDVRTRIAGSGDSILIDIGDESREVVEVTETKWRTVPQPDIDFIRPSGYAALPRPENAPDAPRRFQDLFQLTDDQFRIITAYEVAALMPRGPYPILKLSGQPAGALARAIRSVIDPSGLPVRSRPKDQRDFAIAQWHNWITVIATQSLPPWFDQALWNAYNGDGSGYRQLYADSDEILFRGQRPIILISEEMPVGLAVQVTLNVDVSQSQPSNRRYDAEIEEEMAHIRPGLFSHVLNCLRVALYLREHRPESLPASLPEFAALGSRLELALWPRGSFASAFVTARVADCPILRLVLRFGMEERRWTGPATKLLDHLATNATADERASAGWPADAAAFGKLLRQKSDLLAELGLQIDFWRSPGNERKRFVILTAKDGQS
jgi:hypothetical protein